jgi:ketosteroid isomerase-like protein
MQGQTRDIMAAALQALTAKDKAGFLALLADDAVFIDPHYPQPAMQGKAAISEGLDFSFGMLAQPGFSIRHLWQDGDSGAMEVDTHHRLVTGQELHFPQVFVVETRAGLITRVQTYVPYPPPAAPAAG